MPETFFGWVGLILEKYGPLFLQGTGNTLIIAISGTILGFLVGLLVAIVRTIPNKKPDRARLAALEGSSPWLIPLKMARFIIVKVAKAIMAVYIEVFRGTPMIVQAMVIYYGALQYLNINLPELGAAVFIITINTGAYMAEIVRGGIISVDKGQTEAAHSIGMTHWQTMITVVLPQAIRNIMPAIGNEFVVNIKDSSVLNVISVSELFFMGKSAAGTFYRYFEAYFIIALIYLVLTFTVTRILRLIERRMDGPAHFTIMGSQSDSRSIIAGKMEDEG